MRINFMLLALAIAAPARAQSPVYSNADLGKPIASAARLSPEEAVQVLRGSHSIADLTDYRSPGSGPTIVVMGESSTPWDWPAAAFEPIQPLGNFYDGNVYAPYGGYGYAPYYATSYLNRPRHSGFTRSSTVAPSQAVQTMPASPPSSSAPRHIVNSSQPAGRRR
jgi:hypothetical protein